MVAPYEVLAPQAAAAPPLGGAEAERAAPQVAPAAPVVRLAVPPAEVGALCAERNARAEPTVVPAEPEAVPTPPEAVPAEPRAGRAAAPNAVRVALPVLPVEPVRVRTEPQGQQGPAVLPARVRGVPVERHAVPAAAPLVVAAAQAVRRGPPRAALAQADGVQGDAAPVEPSHHVSAPAVVPTAALRQHGRNQVGPAARTSPRGWRAVPRRGQDALRAYARVLAGPRHVAAVAPGVAGAQGRRPAALRPEPRPVAVWRGHGAPGHVAELQRFGARPPAAAGPAALPPAERRRYPEAGAWPPPAA